MPNELILTALGVASGALLFAGDIPYAVNALKGRTKPHRTTWLIGFVLNIITLVNQLALGATASLGLIIGAVFATGAIFGISIKHGTGGFGRLDLFVLAGSAFGMLLWWILDTPLASIYINIAVVSLSLVPTYRKAYRDPASETRITWLLGAIAAFLAALSVGQIWSALLIVPVYSFFSQAGLYAILKLRQSKA